MASAGDPPILSSSSSPLPTVNTCYDPSDIDAFINYDHPQSPNSMRSKPSLSQQSSMSSTLSTGSNAGNSSFATSQSSQIPYSGPSHEYGSYKQQTGLPPGGLANTMAINNATGMNFSMGSHGMMMNTNEFFNPQQPTDEFINFGAAPVPNFADASEMDLENGTPTHGLPAFYPSGTPNKSEFIDPNALGGHEMSPVGPPTQVGRMYPGMHQQQAAMAKAAQQQKQQELLRQQQQQRHQQQQQQQQQQAPQQHAQQLNGRMEQANLAARSQNKANRPTDPVVEERISRLLQQMRQSSVASQEDDASSASNVLPHIAKMKKEEEDMDEDERLLASEEGKKLSSKERRQLRNKVSARAFRSRRKEYIGQLEGEVAAKTNEANDLRVRNRALAEENSRLTDLTRMLLSSSHFSSFLNDISINGLPAPPPQQTPATQPPVQSTQKDANPNLAGQDIQMQQDPQVGMALVPEQGMDYGSNTGLDLNNPGWNTGIDMNFTNAQVFAVVDVPEGPAVDTSIISGKSSNSVGPSLPEESKDQIPQIERPAPVEATKPEKSFGAPVADVEIDESDPAFALFIDQPNSLPNTRESPESTVEPFDDLFGGVVPEKVFARLDLVVDDGSHDVGAATMHRLERLCSSMDAAFHRVSSATSHL
ncbi:hypothetical protein FQN54_001273 [Arachnomyces sp. PD_36]|nr:hypothetical protein FQN54_001273 [Arachnomyces sp. PD_36]